jgi:hypothetical protein
MNNNAPPPYVHADESFVSSEPIAQESSDEQKFRSQSVQPFDSISIVAPENMAPVSSFAPVSSVTSNPTPYPAYSQILQTQPQIHQEAQTSTHNVSTAPANFYDHMLDYHNRIQHNNIMKIKTKLYDQYPLGFVLFHCIFTIILSIIQIVIQIILIYNESYLYYVGGGIWSGSFMMLISFLTLISGSFFSFLFFICRVYVNLNTIMN